MPEFKHQFTSGKMNKDLDERLVPGGEYRHAMNVQVSTSDGSDVGTVQNILPNIQGCTDQVGVKSVPPAIPYTATTVGSISDEKNDSFYWFISGLSTKTTDTSTPQSLYNILNITQINEWLTSNGEYLFKDIIMKASSSSFVRPTLGSDSGTGAAIPVVTCEPVFVDVWGFVVSNMAPSFWTNSFNLGSADLSNLLQPGWIAATYTSTGIHSTATVSTVTEYIGTVPVTPAVVYNTSVQPAGFFGQVSLGVIQSGGYWTYNGIIYLLADLSNGSVNGSNPTNLIPEVGDIITALDFVNGLGASDPGVTFQIGGVDVQSATIQSVGMLNLQDNNGDYNGFYQITTDATLVPDSTGISANMNFNIMMGGWYNPPNSTNMLLPQYFGMLIDRNHTTCSLDPAAIVYFDYSQNYHFNSLVVGDSIGTSSTYQAGGCINDLQLATYSSDGQIIIDDCAGTIVMPQSIYPSTTSPTDCGNNGPFTINLPTSGNDTIVQFNGSLSTQHPSSGATLPVMFLNPNRVLNFNIDKLITAKNIIDDLLLWTDTYSEPKKINISRSISGTLNDGSKHTELVNSYIEPLTGRVPTREEHIVVIRRAPSKTLTVLTEPYTTLSQSNPIVINKGFHTINNAVFPNNVFEGTTGGGINTGESLLISFAPQTAWDPTIPFEYGVGDILRFSEYNVSVTSDTYDIRASVLEVFNTNTMPSYPAVWMTSGFAPAGSVVLRVEIVSVTEDAPTNSSQNITWEAIGEETGKRLFERKLPRFSYRYKYLDNEYSTIAPFTDVIFEPGEFEYHPTEAYNTGMVNNIKSLTLKDFVPSDIPADVMQVDLLYKNDTDPNVYIIDSVTAKDSNSANAQNIWNSNGTVDITNQTISRQRFSTSGSYDIKTENIFAALPANQTLRVWDNVPRLALAQEVTGNRIVYGNYLQNYSLKDNNGVNQIPDIIAGLQTRTFDTETSFGKKSIKSLRNYDIGVVWGDKYGRETPVITPNTGSLKVGKARAEQSNFISLTLNNSPSWANYYKLYIKETSNEYYNLALGRVYEDGEDDNVWLAFPSIDRNKVDEDTYLILKKGVGEDSRLIEEEARFKIVAIENEAPEQIKTSYTKLLRTTTDDSRPLNSCNMYGGSGVPCTTLPSNGMNAPIPGQLGFSLNISHWTGPWDVLTKYMGLTHPQKIFEEVSANPGQDELWVAFSKVLSADIEDFSSKYQVISVDEDADPSVNAIFIKLATPIKSEDEFITEHIDAGNDNIHVHFYKKSIENKPEFDGRFFVKIHKDIDKVVETHLITIPEKVSNWGIQASTNVYEIDDGTMEGTPVGSNDGSFSKATSLSSHVNNSSNSIRTKSKFSSYLQFGTGGTKGYWFVDKAPFASIQPLTSNYYVNPNNYNNPLVSTEEYGIRTCDTTSYVSWYWQGKYAKYDGNNNEGTGQSNGSLGMRGAFAAGGDQYLDLSYSKLEPDGDWGRVWIDKLALDWRVGVPGNNKTDDEIDVVRNLSINTRFKIKGNDTIYKIKSVRQFRLFNYLGRINPHDPDQTFYAGHQWSDLYRDETLEMSRSTNRRLTYRIKYEEDVASVGSNFPLSSNTSFTSVTNSSPVELQFLTEFDVEGENKLSAFPAIFETEPKEDLDLDLYYEASDNIPTLPINDSNKHMFIPVGATIGLKHDVGVSFPKGVFVTGWTKDDDGEDLIVLSDNLSNSDYSKLTEIGAKFTRDDGSYTTADIIVGAYTAGFPTIGGNVAVHMLYLVPTRNIGLGWFNCWSFGNGVESNRIGDTYNKPFITNGAKVSTVLDIEYTEEHRKYGLIYSGIYNSNSGVNNLNQFIAAEKITKDVNPIYGSIQKLHSRNSDLVALCEDKVLKILANKDALYNADGNPQLTATNNVLGQTIPFAGEYGISKNPESFASEAYRAYFTDKVRGAVIRLSKDGLTAISEHGMKDWFRDNLKLYSNLIGSYDDKKQEYNITLTHTKR